MRIVVQKYGGSSLSTPEKIRKVASKIVAEKRAGVEVVVVVSAMGGTTDTLLSLARATTDNPPARELDLLLTTGEQISSSLLCMALADLGQDALSLSGSQAGIVTTDTHHCASILEVRPQRIRAELEQGKVVVVAGFQGLSYRGEVTTLGRGGSDTSAVALAASLQAQRCDICSDVDGIYSSDPRLVPQARRIQEIGYDEMLEMARCGARVLHQEAVELARRSGLEICARASFDDGPGTLVRKTSGVLGRVVGIAGRADLFKLSWRDPKLLRQLRSRLGEVQVMRGAESELLLTAENVPDLAALRDRLTQEFRNDLVMSAGLGSVSVIGAGYGDCPQRIAQTEAALRQAGLEPTAVYAESLAVTGVLPSDLVPAANRLLHEAFLGAEVSACPR